MQLRGTRRRRGVDRGFVHVRPRRLAGPAAGHRRHRRRARARHPRQRRGDGALADASTGWRRRASRPSTATTTWPTSGRRAGRRDEARGMKALRRAVPRARRDHSSHAKQAALQRYFAPRRRPTRPGRCTSWPAASRGSWCRRKLLRAAGAGGGGPARVAVRRELRSGRRPGRNHRAAAAAADRARTTWASPTGSSSTCCRCARRRPRTLRRRAARAVAPARRRRAAGLLQAHHRRLPRRRVAAAGDAGAGGASAGSTPSASRSA